MSDLLWILVIAVTAFMLGRTSADEHCPECGCDDDDEGPGDDLPTCPDDLSPLLSEEPR